MIEMLKDWWRGTYKPPPRDPIMIGRYKAVHASLDFWLKYWQWGIGVVLAIFFGFWKR